MGRCNLCFLRNNDDRNEVDDKDNDDRDSADITMARKIMIEPMMKRASTILNLSISAIFDENQMFSR